MNLPLSFVAEYEYCPRSSYYLLTDAPISRDENSFIQSGRKAHQAVDKGYVYSKASKKVVSSLRVFSERYGLHGKIDIVEFHKNKELVPVELKRGKKRHNPMHEMQIALTALCLQEMCPEHAVKDGAVFFTEDRQKIIIKLTDELLVKAKQLAQEISEKLQLGLKPVYFPCKKDKRCKGCCFYQLCYIN